MRVRDRYPGPHPITDLFNDLTNQNSSHNDSVTQSGNIVLQPANDDGLQLYAAHRMEPAFCLYSRWEPAGPISLTDERLIAY